MNESVFCLRVKGERLYGIWHQAEGDTSASLVRKAVVFLHGWGGYRTGPHDLLVKLARSVTQMGYHCFRFDFRGKGYSEGDKNRTGNRSMLEDLEAVLHFVDFSLEHPEITLAGICSGAYLALFYACSGTHPIVQVIELSSPVLRLNEEVRSVVATNQAKHTFHLYVSKLFRRDTWLKLTNGEIHFEAICKNIVRPLRLLGLSWKRSWISRPMANPDREKAVKERRPFGGLSGQLLLIHGEKDPETQPALEQICGMLDSASVPYTLHIVKNANHSFYALRWEEEIIEVIRKWLSLQ